MMSFFMADKKSKKANEKEKIKGLRTPEQMLGQKKKGNTGNTGNNGNTGNTGNNGKIYYTKNFTF